MMISTKRFRLNSQTLILCFTLALLVWAFYQYGSSYHPTVVHAPISPSNKGSHEKYPEFTSCFLKSTSWEETQMCFSDEREKQLFSIYEAIEKIPKNQLQRFARKGQWVTHFEPHELLYPTFECDQQFVKRVGADGDGGKWMCTNFFKPEEECTIFSLGSRGDFSFEEAIDKETGGRCQIHTFDCTGEWNHTISKFHNWCLGSEDTVIDGKIFKTLATIAKELKVKSIDLLKMDIEEYEWPVFESLLTQPTSFLPRQVLFELHFGMVDNILDFKPEEGWITHSLRMANWLRTMGYRIAFREINPWGGTACEYVIVRP